VRPLGINTSNNPTDKFYVILVALPSECSLKYKETA